jgi:hypothetical protein
VAHLRHARTVTSKNAPAITQQLTKRCFLRAVSSRTEPSRAAVGKGHLTAAAVTSRVSSDATIKAFSRMSDQGFIRVLESYRGVLDGRQPWKFRKWRREDCLN